MSAIIAAMEQQVNIRTIRLSVTFATTFLTLEFMKNGIFWRQAMVNVHAMALVAL